MKRPSSYILSLARCLLFAVLCAAILPACAGADSEDASSRLLSARQLIADNRFNAAKLQLDSINLLYPRNIDARREAQHLSDTLMLLEAERTLHYSDSLLQVLNTKADSLLPLFRYEKDPRYQSRGYYIHPTLLSTKNSQRTYLQAEVADDGNLVLRSHYFGSAAINHTRLKVTAGDNYTQFSGSTHHFYADGHYEILTCTDERCLQVLQLIAADAGSKVTITLSGDKKSTTYTLTPSDITALVQTLELCYLLSDIRRAEQTFNNADMQIRLMYKRLNPQPAS